MPDEIKVSDQQKIVVLRNGLEYFQFLNKHNLLQSWLEFQRNFFTPLLRDLKKGEQELEINGEILRISDVLRYLPDLLRDTNFFHSISQWREDQFHTMELPYAFTQPNIAKKLTDGLDFREYIRENGQLYETSRQNEIIQKVEQLRTKIKNLLQEQTETVEPDYSKQLAQALNDAQPSIQKMLQSHHDLLAARPNKIEFEDTFSKQVESMMALLPAEEREATQAQITRLHDERLQKLNEDLTKFAEDVRLERQSEVNSQRQSIEKAAQPYSLEAITGQPAILQLLLKHCDAQEIPPVLDQIRTFILGRVEPFSVEGAATDTQKTFNSIAASSEKLQKVIEKEQQKLITAAQKELQKKVSDLLGFIPAVTTETPDGGGGEAPEEAVEDLDELQSLVLFWKQASEEWRKKVRSYQALAPEKQADFQRIFSQVTGITLSALEDASFDWQAWAESLEEKYRGALLAPARALLYLLQALPTVPTEEISTEEPVEEPAAPEPVPEPETPPTPPTSGQPLATPFTETDEASLEPVTSRGDKIRQIGKVARDKATLDTLVLGRLEEILKQQGMLPEQIEKEIELFRANLSNELWLALLQEGVLQNKLELQQLIKLEREFVQRYAQLILGRQVALAGPSSTDFDQLPSDFFKSFHPQSVSQALQYARELEGLSPEQRVSLINDLLRAEGKPEIPSFFSTFFLGMIRDPSSVQQFYLLDRLAFHVYRVNSWQELLPDQQEKLRGYIHQYLDSLELYGLVFGQDLNLLNRQLQQFQTVWDQAETYLGQFSGRTGKFVSALPGFTGKKKAVAPVAEGDTPEPLIDLSTQLWIVNTLDDQVVTYEQRQVLEMFVIEKSMRGHDLTVRQFASLIGYLRNPNEGEPLDPRFQAELGSRNEFADFQAKVQAQGIEAAHSEQYHQYMAAQQANGLSALSAREKLMYAQKIAQAIAGNPIALIGLLNDPRLRQLVIQELQKKAPVIIGLPVGGAALGYTAVRQAIDNALAMVGIKRVEVPPELVARFGERLEAAQAAQGAGELTESLKDASSEAGKALRSEAAGAMDKIGQGVNQLKEGLKAVSNNITALSSAKSIAWLAGITILAPLGSVALLTIIVITVIGASLNDLPTGFIRSRIPGLGNVCWPTTGTITTPPNTPGHLTSSGTSGATAIDIGAPLGTPVYSPFSGTVEIADSSNDWNDGYGRYVRLRTDQGFVVIFAHLITVAVEENQRVQNGTPIGEVGSTRNSSGNHLHYEVIGRGNIQEILPATPPAVDGAEVSATQCTNFGPTAEARLVQVQNGGGGYAYIFNQGYEFVTQASLGSRRTVGDFATRNNLDAAINTNFFDPLQGYIRGIYSDGAGRIGAEFVERPAEISVLFLRNGQTLPESTVNKLTLGSGSNRVLYNNHGVVVLNILGVSSSQDDERVIRQEIFPLVEHAISGVPPVMINGAPTNMAPYANTPDYDDNRARTFFAFREANGGLEYAFIVVRSADYTEFASVIQELGFTYAISLDGGHSSQMYIKGRDFATSGGALDNFGGWTPEGPDGANVRVVPALIGIQKRN